MAVKKVILKKLDETEARKILKLSPYYKQMSSDDVKKEVEWICESFQNKSETLVC